MRIAIGIPVLMLAAVIPAGAQESDTAWTIRGGTYGGQTVLIDRAAATKKGSRFWRLTSLRDEKRIVGWNPSRLPVAVAFRSGTGVSESDSATFWTILRRMESDIGLQLFTPVTLDGDLDPDDVIVVALKPMASNDGMTLVTWTNHGSLYDSRVFFSSKGTMRDEKIVAHEMMHALGFGHTSSWPSVMNPGRSSPARLTSHDVAYTQISLAWRALYERADMWSRLALAVSREPASPHDDGLCRMFTPPVRNPDASAFRGDCEQSSQR